MSEPIVWTNCQVRLGELKRWEDNPAEIGKEAAGRLVDSFNEFGQVETLAIDPDNMLIDGHQRLDVWQAKFGSDMLVDCRRASRALTIKERQKIAVLLRSGAVGRYDWDKVSGWDADDLKAWGFDDSTLRDWKRDTSALERFIESEKEDPVDAEPQIDRAAELNEKWQVKTGDLWKIGDHRLLCGDSTVKADVDRVMVGEKAGAIVTDPPYGINREGIENDDPKGLAELFRGCLSVAPVDDAIIISFQSPRLFHIWFDACRDYGAKFERLLWMHRKAGKAFPWRGWVLVGDPIQISSVGNPEWGEPNKHEFDCYIKDELEPRELDGLHSTIKPLDVIEDLVTHTTGDVYEPFCGSGTTMVACENLHRKCRAIEISPNYCAVILERMATAFPDMIIEKVQNDNRTL